jgi:hypothetical protein
MSFVRLQLHAPICVCVGLQGPGPMGYVRGVIVAKLTVQDKLLFQVVTVAQRHHARTARAWFTACYLCLCSTLYKPP